MIWEKKTDGKGRSLHIFRTEPPQSPVYLVWERLKSDSDAGEFIYSWVGVGTNLRKIERSKPLPIRTVARR